jgi:hypothetical protein
MKNKIILWLIFCSFLVSCKEPKKEIVTVKPKEVTANKCLPRLIDNPKLQDEMVLVFADEEIDSVLFSKNELNKIEILFPVFKAKYPSNPNESYAGKSWENYINQDGKEESITFGSEVGRDNFCLLYAYYLKQKNGEQKYKLERKKLSQLYNAVNGLYQALNYGGTYFGHQYERLYADVEYSIYQLAVGKEYYEKKYNFQKQKDLYIKTLIQYVADEESHNVDYQEDLRSNKKRANKRAKQLQEKINILQKLITNYFYLNQVQNFEITYYK